MVTRWCIFGLGGDLAGKRGGINKLIRKTVRGLFYHHFGGPLGDVDFLIDFNPKDPLVHLWKRLTGWEVGKEIFRYWFGVAKEDPGLSWWWLVYYDRVLFVAGTCPEQFSGKILPGEVREPG